jgi:hypothetical protein
MRLFPRTLSVALSLPLALAAMPLFAQDAAAPSAPKGPDISQSLSTLADQPATHTGFVFDRSMLQFARGMLESEGMSSKRAAVALSSIAYDNYRYPQPAVYTPATMASIVAAYDSAGWKHLVSSHEHTRDADPGQPQHRHPATDLWLHFSGSDIDGLTVMARNEKNVNVIQVACDLRPIDLLHLGGHFGIPKVDPDAVMVPAPDGH